jgi:hypothetical protein
VFRSAAESSTLPVMPFEETSGAIPIAVQAGKATEEGAAAANPRANESPASPNIRTKGVTGALPQSAQNRFRNATIRSQSTGYGQGA